MARSTFSRKVQNLIAEFRGLPTDRSRARERDTRGGADLMEHILQKYRIGMATPEDAIRDAWVDIVGEPNAAFCHPLRIDRQRVLIVGVTNPVIRQEMMFHKSVIVRRIQEIPGCKQISSIIFRGA